MHNRFTPILPAHVLQITLRLQLLALIGLFVSVAYAQVDPIERNQLELGYDQSLSDNGPQAAYAYYHLNVPEFHRTNVALRLAVAPVYFDGELGIRGVGLPYTDVGIGIAGGAFSDNYYEVRQGDYRRSESFYGHSGGGALSLYQLLNPGQRVPLHLVARGGFRYSAYSESGKTDDNFVLPDDRGNLFARAGLRLAGREPELYPDIGLEVSVWFERLWRLQNGRYGFAGDRSVNAGASLYWLYAGLNYAWTSFGYKVSVGFTLGGSDDTDRFSAWRLGGVLPLVSEFPLILPGYYYQEISAERFAHFYAAYTIALDRQDCWALRVEGASARVDYLPGFEQSSTWNSGAGLAVVYTSPNKVLKVALRYGYGFNALRGGKEGAHSVGILVQYDFTARKHQRAQQ